MPTKPRLILNFLRRVTPDLIGEVLTYEETVAFLDDKTACEKLTTS